MDLNQILEYLRPFTFNPITIRYQLYPLNDLLAGATSETILLSSLPLFRLELDRLTFDGIIFFSRDYFEGILIRESDRSK